MAIGKMKFKVFCTARMRWVDRAPQPVKRVRSAGHAEHECRKLARENPGSVCVVLGPGNERVIER